jgi:hypothetical protein
VAWPGNSVVIVTVEAGRVIVYIEVLVDADKTEVMATTERAFETG